MADVTLVSTAIASLATAIGVPLTVFFAHRRVILEIEEKRAEKQVDEMKAAREQTWTAMLSYNGVLQTRITLLENVREEDTRRIVELEAKAAKVDAQWAQIEDLKRDRDECRENVRSLLAKIVVLESVLKPGYKHTSENDG